MGENEYQFLMTWNFGGHQTESGNSYRPNISSLS